MVDFTSLALTRAGTALVSKVLTCFLRNLGQVGDDVRMLPGHVISASDVVHEVEEQVLWFAFRVEMRVSPDRGDGEEQFPWPGTDGLQLFLMIIIKTFVRSFGRIVLNHQRRYGKPVGLLGFRLVRTGKFCEGG